MLFPLELSFKIGCDIAFFCLSTVETNLNIFKIFKIISFQDGFTYWQVVAEKPKGRGKMCLSYMLGLLSGKEEVIEEGNLTL